MTLSPAGKEAPAASPAKAPAGKAAEKAAPHAAPASPSTAKAKTIDEYVEQQIKAGEWKEHTDPKTQKKYYVSKAKKIVWDLKKELMPYFEKQK